ncbi:hypothetical protein ACIHDR_43870, partial [Nocardia sp. NPDC052278]
MGFDHFGDGAAAVCGGADIAAMDRGRRAVRFGGPPQAVGAHAAPLIGAADRTSAWAWLPYRSEPSDAVAAVRDFASKRPEAPRLAIG